jgi:hypothetical protein
MSGSLETLKTSRWQTLLPVETGPRIRTFRARAEAIEALGELRVRLSESFPRDRADPLELALFDHEVLSPIDEAMNRLLQIAQSAEPTLEDASRLSEALSVLRRVFKVVSEALTGWKAATTVATVVPWDHILGLLTDVLAVFGVTIADALPYLMPVGQPH